MPVVTTIIGVLIGFFESVAMAFFNKRLNSEEAKEGRDRERLEKVYQLLLDISSEYKSSFSKVIGKVHENLPITSEQNDSKPPLIQLEMLVKLYHPYLVESHSDLVKTKDVIGVLFTKALVTGFEGKSLDYKQQFCGKYLDLIHELDQKIENMQNEIAQKIKAYKLHQLLPKNSPTNSRLSPLRRPCSTNSMTLAAEAI